MTANTLNATFTAKETFISVVLQTAIDAGYYGIGYWGTMCVNTKLGHYVRIAEPTTAEDGVAYPLDWDRAFKCAVAEKPSLLDLNMLDANAADLWIQYAAFGKIVFA